jgi:sigma-B regulation protein RsbU (phosphoserine phosphatase)
MSISSTSGAQLSILPVRAGRRAHATHWPPRRCTAACDRRTCLPGLGLDLDLDLAARYVTGSGPVGGDWYDVFILPDGRLGVVVGDVAGSGLEAGVIMGRMRSALRACVLEAADPGTALSRLDRESQYFEPDAMATVLYGLYTPRTGELAISLAGHLPPVLATPGRRAGPIPVQPDPPIGTAGNLHRRTTITSIPPEALLCCFTDGLVERRDESIDHGIGKLAAILRGQIPASTTHDPVDAGQLTDDACAAVVRAMTGQASATDDIAVLMLRRRPLTASSETRGRKGAMSTSPSVVSRATSPALGPWESRRDGR